MDDGPNSGILLIVLIILVGMDIALRLSGKIRAMLKARKEAQAAAEENILSMVNESHEQGYIEASEAEMISNIFEFGDKQAQDIMTDRSNITAIEAEMTLNEAMNLFIGKHNFLHFCANKEEDEYIKEIYEFKYRFEDDMLIFDIIGDGFKRYMVRMIIGTVLAYVDHQIDLNYIKDRLSALKDLQTTSYNAEPQGLYLMEVYYD